ncbi:regulatory protein [Nonlabens dokdonensis]|uniref:Regulatory protein RecX n=2 Tax=Nonlabens dokdonensis TaxID=328515 RepID=L7W945_NONDD|nr:regulatory protein RecX [Nonlabens dokdonensis]AGC76321.1 putative transcriptional regulatory protein RecX [Nonlabens dokdonensis DSW-6]PZX43983.1 regulatory protein [Nonlabens dokdonensis]
MQQESFTVEEATRAIERYCAYQERCHKDVVDKLKSMGMIELAIDEIIPHLIHHKFLNETRYAESFARGKFRIKKWGKNRIIRELKMKGLNDRTIKIGLKEISESDYILAFDTLSRKRLQQLTTETDKYKKRKKLADYLLYRGWESHMVYAKTVELIP